MNIKHINWKKELKDWRNWLIVGMSSWGTLMGLISWLSKPEVQQAIREGMRI